MKIKMSKLQDDPCYGKKYNQIEQCKACWVINPCERVFNNMIRKAREEQEEV